MGKIVSQDELIQATARDGTCGVMATWEKRERDVPTFSWSEKVGDNGLPELDQDDKPVRERVLKTIKEIIKDLNISPAPPNVETTVGATVPATINLSPMPQVVAEKVPQVKSHLFFVEDGKVVIVDPKENK